MSSIVLANHDRNHFDAHVGMDNGVGYSFDTDHPSNLQHCYFDYNYSCADVDYSDNALVYATNEDEVNTWFYSIEVTNLYDNPYCGGYRFQQYGFTGNVWSFGVYRGDIHWLHLGPYASYPGWGWVGSSLHIGYADDGKGYYQQADSSWVYLEASSLYRCSGSLYWAGSHVHFELNNNSISNLDWWASQSPWTFEFSFDD